MGTSLATTPRNQQVGRHTGTQVGYREGRSLNPIRIMLDVECYTDYFMVGFLNPEDGRMVQFEKYAGHPFDAKSVLAIMKRRQTVGFNSNSYDNAMIFLACYGLSNEELKRASDMIIVGKQKSWHLEKYFDVRFPQVDHIDIFEIPAGQASLKIYGGRIHSKRMQDLPIRPDELIEPVKRPELRKNMCSYNGNDLWTTHDLLKAVAPQLALRETLSDEYGIDLRSKSDAQIAEAVIRSEIQKITGTKLERPLVDTNTVFQYKVPEFIQFKTPALRQLLADVKAAKFTLSESSKVVMPPELEDRVIRIGGSAFRMGIGGLHSSEKSRAHYSDDEYVLIDRDVKSYYPMIILLCSLFPKHLGPVFLKVFGKIVRRRLKAKELGDDVVAEVLKIVVNGSFGKLGSVWSCLFAPDLMIQVTVTGQLALLMFVEMLYLAGHRVVSANTDGLVIKARRDREDHLNSVVKAWEKRTGFETEESRYSAVFSRDVNNYVAMLEKPKVKKGKTIYCKTKGAYADPGLTKNPTNQICVEAVIDYLVHGKEIDDTIRECTDIRRFVSIRKVDGGASKVYDYCPPAHASKEELLKVSGYLQVEGDDNWRRKESTSDYAVVSLEQAYQTAVRMYPEKGELVIGKSIRWYYSTSTRTAIHYVKTGNLVPRTEGAMPLMELPDDFPSDVDYDWYIREAQEILKDIGAIRRIPVLGPLVAKRIEALV
ncbi:MAG: hypothetical protein ACREA9_05235 [Pyrinomonadaceae bacterium]